MISPRPQVHTPVGTEVTDTPKTSSTGSHPIECRSSASSMLRSEVTARPLGACPPPGQPVRRAEHLGPDDRAVCGSAAVLTTAGPWDGAAASGRSP